MKLKKNPIGRIAPSILPLAILHILRYVCKNFLVCSIVSSSQTTTTASGIIKSYDYPSKYIRDKVECYWPIVAAQNQVVRLIVEELDVNGCKSCGSLQVIIRKRISSP
jgi:hypothetical protein